MELDAYFRERILVNDFLIFEIVEKSFQTGNLPLNAFDFVMTVQACNICLQVFFAIGVAFLFNICGELKKVNLISLNRFGI